MNDLQRLAVRSPTLESFGSPAVHPANVIAAKSVRQIGKSAF